MKTPKEKAIELVEKFRTHTYNGADNLYSENAKRCALIAVNVILESEPILPNEANWDDCGAAHKYYYEEKRSQAKKYWQEVKSEIEKLKSYENNRY
jgi:hypothetical protein